MLYFHFSSSLIVLFFLKEGLLLDENFYVSFFQADFALLLKFMPLFADKVKCDLQHNNQPTEEHIIWKLGMQTVKNVQHALKIGGFIHSL